MSEWQFIVACISLVVLGIGFEGLKVIQQKLVAQIAATQATTTEDGYYNLRDPQEQQQQREDTAAAIPLLVRLQPRDRRWRIRLLCALQSLLYAIQLTISYFLMVMVMTYNMGLLFAVLVGAVVGHYFLITGGGIGASTATRELTATTTTVPAAVACHV